MKFEVKSVVRHLFLIFTLVGCAAAEKQTDPVSMEDEYLILTASALLDKQAIGGALGHDPGMDLIVIDVKVAPRGEHKIKVNFDDFILISRKDGQKSQPLAPSQIAGRGALVVNQSGGGAASGVYNNNRGPMWGGMPGTGTRPRRIGGDGDAVVTGSEGETRTTVNAGGKESENPLLAVLKERALPQDETNDVVTGFLYFFLEGKHKLKDLELLYQSPAGRMILDFEK